MKITYRKPVLWLFSGEILSIVGALFTAFMAFAAWCGIVGLTLSIISLAISLIAIIALKTANEFFHRSFKFVIASIIITLLALIFASVASTGQIWAFYVSIVLNSLRLVNGIIIVSSIVRGCKELVASVKGDNNFGTLSVKIYGACIILGIVLLILLAIPAIYNNNTANSIISAIQAISLAVAGVIYVVTLGRTVKRLKR